MGTAPIADFNWFFGGNATFTVENPQGEYYTFKVNRPKVDERNPNPPYFIKVMTGPDNESSYTYMGVLKRHGDLAGTVKLTRGSKVQADDRRIRIAEWAIRKVLTNTIPQGYKIMHAGRCCVCGRKLTTPESIARGIGPKCEGRN